MKKYGFTHMIVKVLLISVLLFPVINISANQQVRVIPSIDHIISEGKQAVINSWQREGFPIPQNINVLNEIAQFSIDSLISYGTVMWDNFPSSLDGVDFTKTQAISINYHETNLQNIFHSILTNHYSIGDYTQFGIGYTFYDETHPQYNLAIGTYFIYMANDIEGVEMNITVVTQPPTTQQTPLVINQQTNEITNILGVDLGWILTLDNDYVSHELVHGYTPDGFPIHHESTFTVNAHTVLTITAGHMFDDPFWDNIYWVEINGNKIKEYNVNDGWRVGNRTVTHTFSTIGLHTFTGRYTDSRNLGHRIITVYFNVVSDDKIRETPSSWAISSVNRATQLNIVPSNLNNTYTQAVTRAEFAAYAVELYEAVTGRVITERMYFNDTDDINVQKMGGLGVVVGSGGNYTPNGTLTREQAAIMLVRLANVLGQPFPLHTATFADNANISSWALVEVGQIQAAGIMGVGSTLFNPQGEYTREQSIITMLRMFDLFSQSPNQVTQVPNQHVVSNISEFERRVFELTNIERANHGLHALIWDDTLAIAARVHSNDMAVNSFVGHRGSDGSGPADRTDRFGLIFNYWGENCIGGVFTPEDCVAGWMSSPGHRANILNEFATHLGVGFAQYENSTHILYGTQKFGRDIQSIPNIKPSSHELQKIEERIINEMNNSFLEAGLSVLQTDTRYTEFARFHATEHINGVFPLTPHTNFFNCQSIVSGITTRTRDCVESGIPLMTGEFFFIGATENIVRRVKEYNARATNPASHIAIVVDYDPRQIVNRYIISLHIFAKSD
jgi:uncharacterized protein YkwD